MAEVEQRTDALSHAVERQLQASFAALTALAESSEAQRGDLAGLYAHAQRLLAREMVGSTIGLSDRQGHTLFVTRLPFGQPLADVGPDDMYARVLDTAQPHVSGLIWGTVTKDLVTLVHVPIIRDGRAEYDLRLGIRPPELLEVLAEQKLPPEWNAVIVDRKGTFLARLKGPAVVGTEAPPELRHALAQGDRGVFDVVNREGETLAAAFQKVPSSGWAVAIGIPHEVLYAPTRRLQRIVLLGGTAALCIGGAVAVLLARRLSLRVCEAVEAATALGKGDPPTPVQGDVRELAELGAALAEAHLLLRQRGERLALAFQAARAAPWDYEVQADRFIWSPESYRLFGFSPENAPVTKAQWLAFLAADDCDSVTAAEAWQEFRVNHPERGVRWIAGIGKEVCDSTGRTMRVTGINLDITDLKLAEQGMLEAKQEAEEANLAKSRFLASASHDMRQPVQSMMMFTSVLEQQLAGHPTVSLVSHIDKAAMSLKTLLDGLLDVSRLEAGVIVPQVADVPVGALFDELAGQYRPQASQNGLDFRVVRTGLWVRTDSSLLERILRNLIENAIKYTSTGRVLVGCRRHGGEALMQVLDTGMGIPQNQLRAVFNEFHQLDNPERDRSKGLGLGLSIVQRLAKLLDHRIEVVSTVGRGSCFAVHVPIVMPAAAAGEPLPGGRPVPDGPVSEGHMAVVIDDEEDVRKGLQLQLQAWGYDVVAGADNRGVLPLLRGRRPDFILADYRLRDGLTGIAVLRELERRLGGAIRGILLTGDTAPARIVEARLSGYEVLHKPITATTLRDHLSHDWPPKWGRWSSAARC